MFVSFFFFSSFGAHRDLHSFPTRRSSDLELIDSVNHGGRLRHRRVQLGQNRGEGFETLEKLLGHGGFHSGPDRRSEEHTSELQSRVDLVCRLLLEKKKKKNTSRDMTLNS